MSMKPVDSRSEENLHLPPLPTEVRHRGEVRIHRAKGKKDTGKVDVEQSAQKTAGEIAQKTFTGDSSVRQSVPPIPAKKPRALTRPPPIQLSKGLPLHHQLLESPEKTSLEMTLPHRRASMPLPPKPGEVPKDHQVLESPPHRRASMPLPPKKSGIKQG